MANYSIRRQSASSIVVDKEQNSRQGGRDGKMMDTVIGFMGLWCS